MTENKRIALNVVATYARSLFSMACGLFTGRWALMSLGQSDYGLFGVVGGLTAFVMFLNNLLGWALGRFYAVAVGECRANPEEGLRKCQGWFNTAVMIHTAVPLIGIILGYPLGVWMIRNFLQIPSVRIDTCIIVFRWVCLSCFVGMINVPFQSMYSAKQYIAELTVYSFAATTANVLFMYYMVSHPGDWLLAYSIWMCLLSIVPEVVICIRALKVFPECTLNIKMMWNRDRLKELAGYAGWQIFSTLGIMLQTQGVQILYNKYFGAKVNAAATVSLSVNGHANSLSASMQGAFSPAIMNACGEGNESRMRALALRSCKFGTFFMLLFVVPLSIEIHEILALWLKTPPPFAAGLCICIFLASIFGKVASGHHIAICAKGQVAAYQFVAGCFSVLTIPFALAFLCFYKSPYCVGASLAVSSLIYTIIRVYFARKLAGLSLSQWLRGVVMPLIAIVMISFAAAAFPRFFLENSAVRVFITSFVAVSTLLISSWICLFDQEEKGILCSKFARILRK